MDPNQGTGYSVRVSHVMPDGTVRMTETPSQPPWKWATFQRAQGYRSPRVHVIVMVGNHRFRGVLRRIVQQGYVPACFRDNAVCQ